TITAQASTNSVTIDLRAATLVAHDPNAGGFLSRQQGIAGGVTIANKVVIENAIGGSGNDTLVGNSAANNLNGGLGNDTYYIDGANDVIVDAGGNDTVYANFNYSNPNIENVYVNGVLMTSGGAPVTNGFAIHRGTSGKNTLVGSDTNDKMYGLGGNDILIGSKGTDIFVFNTKLNAKTNKDSVQAFVTKEDKIWLDNAIFKKLGKGSESKPEKLKKSFFKIGSKAGDADDFIILDKKTGIASYDLDGNGEGKAVAFAVFDKKALPNLADFFVV
ncbi:MAG: calcium-binding protein, partial [Microvirga sp.]